jgi:hypothetical protein
MASGGCRKAAFIAGIGCLSLLVMGLLLAAAAIYLARRAFQQETAARREPVSVVVPVRDAGPGDGAGEAARDLPAASSAPVRLTLDLAEGIFTVGAAPAGSDLRADGTYDPDRYALTQSVEEIEDDGAAARSITLRFRRKGLVSLFFNTDSTPNHLTVGIPEGVPYALRLRIGKARSESDLGGLTLTRLASEFSNGEHAVRFSRPLAAALDLAEFRSSMGRLDVEGIGNARPRHVKVEGSMGDTRLDFSGAWPRGFEAAASLRVTMGGLRVKVPRAVRVRSASSVVFGSSRSRGMKEEPEDPDAPALELQATASMGDLHLVRE